MDNIARFMPTNCRSEVVAADMGSSFLAMCWVALWLMIRGHGPWVYIFPCLNWAALRLGRKHTVDSSHDEGKTPLRYKSLSNSEDEGQLPRLEFEWEAQISASNSICLKRFD